MAEHVATDGMAANLVDATPTTVARGLLAATRTDEDPDPYLSALAAFDDADLAPLRDDRATALAFWCNLYNAGTQLLLAERAELYESPLRTVRFFRAPVVDLAGSSLSLDDVEHGILRESRSKYGLGYLPRLLATSFERRYHLHEPDPRIHFALNCGAASCPAIRACEADAVDAQLDLAARSYLADAAAYDSAEETVTLPRLFLWYRGDFGGRNGIRELLREYEVIPDDSSPSISYREWDWTLEPGAFVESESQ